MTGEHLTFGQIADYAAKRLPAERIPAFQAHAQECPSCREMIVATVTASGYGDGAEHITEKQSVDFVAGLLPAGEKRAIEQHLDRCDSCAAMVADLNEFRTIPVRSRWRTLAWVLPVAAALFAILGVSAWRTLRPGHHSPAIVASLRDTSGILQLEQSGALAGNAVWPPDAAPLLAAALRTGRLPAGPSALLTEPHETLRSATGGGPATSFKILFPDGQRVLMDRPEFRWSKLDGASSYEVSVVDENFNELARSGPVHDSVWVPGTSLPRVQPLFWQVTAIRHGVRVIAPAPPEASARFEIVSADAAMRIARARSAIPVSHLLLAALYAEAGLHKDAASELDAIDTLNPGSPLVTSLRQSLTARQ